MNHTQTNRAKDLLLEDFWRVISDAEALIKASAADGATDLSEIRARAEESLARVKAQLGELPASMRARGQEAIATTQDYIQKNPWSALGIAAGVGVLVGLLSGRR